MPSVTYAQAEALAQRLDACRRNGATLLLDGRHVVTGFAFCSSGLLVSILTAEGDWLFFGLSIAKLTPDEFEHYWQERITVTYPGPWPTGERVTTYRVLSAIDELHDAAYQFGEGALKEAPRHAASIAESAERLAHVCRALAAETGE